MFDNLPPSSPGTRDGFSLFSSNGNTLQENSANSNLEHGIKLSHGSSGNVIGGNIALGNGGIEVISFFDLFHDASSSARAVSGNTSALGESG